MVKQSLLIQNRICHIYGTPDAEYMLLQMADEHDLAWLEQAVPNIRQQYSIKEDCKVILGGYSLAGLFALWAATQINALYGVAAASPSVWFPGWPEHEAAHPIQAQRVYLSLGDREEHTKNKSTEPKQVRVHARKYRWSAAPPSRKQKASPRREAPQGCAQASEGAGHSLQKRFRENLAVKLNRFCRSTNLF